MNATGRLYLSKKQKPVGARAADGTFVLTMLAFDRISSRDVTPWALTWAGNDAFDFWELHRHQLQPGAVLDVSLTKVRPMSVFGRYSGVQEFAEVQTLAVLPSTSAAADAPRETDREFATV